MITTFYRRRCLSCVSQEQQRCQSMSDEPKPPVDEATEAELAQDRAMIRSSRVSLAVDRQIIAASREAVQESRRRLRKRLKSVMPPRQSALVDLD